MAITNKEIIQSEAILINYNWNGGNLNTYAQWQKLGYQVPKGAKAIINTTLWKPCTSKDKTTGKEKTTLFMVKASLFSLEQVNKMTQEELKAYENKQDYWKNKKKVA